MLLPCAAETAATCLGVVHGGGGASRGLRLWFVRDRGGVGFVGCWSFCNRAAVGTHSGYSGCSCRQWQHTRRQMLTRTSCALSGVLAGGSGPADEAALVCGGAEEPACWGVGGRVAHGIGNTEVRAAAYYGSHFHDR